MATKRRVFSYNDLPSRPMRPVFDAIIVGLLLDRLAASGWVWGAVGLFFFLLLCGVVGRCINETQFNHFKNKDE